MSKVTFIIPIYKVEDYLPRTISSLKAQTLEDWESVLVDDGSPDRCGEICDEAAKTDSRIKVIHQRNSGVAAARNAGLEVATGKYIQFIDSDDFILPETAMELVGFADENDVDLLFFGIRKITYDALGAEVSSEAVAPPILGVYRDEPCKRLFDRIANQSYVHTKLYRRKLISSSNLRFRERSIGEDGLFMADVYACNPNCVAGVEKAYYQYTIRQESLTNSYHPERVKDNFYLSDRIAEVVRDWGLESSRMHMDTVHYCCMLDFQYGIKNVCSGPLPTSERIKWLRETARTARVSKAIKAVPVSRFTSRNDRIKSFLLKMHLYRLIVFMSSRNNKA